MKNTLLVIVVLLVSGCATYRESTPEAKAANAEKVLRAMVIGVYEHKDGENIQRAIFQNNGVLEVYVNSNNEAFYITYEAYIISTTSLASNLILIA